MRRDTASSFTDILFLGQSVSARAYPRTISRFTTRTGLASAVDQSEMQHFSRLLSHSHHMSSKILDEKRWNRFDFAPDACSKLHTCRDFACKSCGKRYHRFKFHTKTKNGERQMYACAVSSRVGRTFFSYVCLLFHATILRSEQTEEKTTRKCWPWFRCSKNASTIFQHISELVRRS